MKLSQRRARRARLLRGEGLMSLILSGAAARPTQSNAYEISAIMQTSTGYLQITFLSDNPAFIRVNSLSLMII